MMRKLILLFGCFIIISGLGITQEIVIDASKTNDLTTERTGDHQNSSVLHLEHKNLVSKIGDDKDLIQADENRKQEGITEDISKEKAITLVREFTGIPENSPIKVQFDHINDQGNYVVHVFEYVADKQNNTGHTATIGWYIVDHRQGNIESMF